MVAAAALAAVSARAPASDQPCRSLGRAASAAARSTTALVLHQAEGRAIALLEHHQLHCRISFRSSLGVTAASARMRSIAHSRCLSHQPYCTGQSSMASTALRPSAISAICGQHGLTSASRPMAIRSARPLLQDVLGEMRIDDQAHRHRHDAGLPAHALGERHLKSPRPLHARGSSRTVKTARRTVDHVDAARLEFLGVGHGIFHGSSRPRCHRRRRRARTAACPWARRRARPRQPRGESACGPQNPRRRHRCACCRGARETDASGSRAHCGFRAPRSPLPAPARRRRPSVSSARPGRRWKAGAARCGLRPSARPSAQRCPTSCRPAPSPRPSAARCRARAVAWSPCVPHARSECRAQRLAPS